MRRQHGGVGSNQYQTVGDSHDISETIQPRQQHGRVIEEAAWTFEDEPGAVTAEDVADVFTPSTDGDWEWATDEGETNVFELRREYTIPSARRAWEQAGVRDGRRARRLAGQYHDHGVISAREAAWCYQHRVAPPTIEAWNEHTLLAPWDEPMVRWLGDISPYVTPQEFAEMVHGRPLQPDRRCDPEPLVALAAGLKETKPAVLRRTVQNLTGLSKTAATGLAVRAAEKSNQNLWHADARVAWCNAARKPVWWSRWFQRRVW